jgi:hypothetical protein
MKQAAQNAKTTRKQKSNNGFDREASVSVVPQRECRTRVEHKIIPFIIVIEAASDDKSGNLNRTGNYSCAVC